MRMKSRRSFLQFLALAPVAVVASSKIVEAVATATSMPATTTHVYMTPTRINALINEPARPERQLRLLTSPKRYRFSIAT